MVITTSADNDDSSGGIGHDGESGRKLKLYGTITSGSSPSTRNVVWSINSDSNVNLETTTGMRVSGTIASGSVQNFHLVIPASSLAERSVYTFTLTSGTAFSSTQILMNGAPTSGELHVTPSSGDALSTYFQFLAMNWQDEDLPLQYTFGYKSTLRSSDVLIRGMSEFAFETSTLPPGSLECFVRVYDLYGANVTALDTVMVNTPSSLSSLLQTLNNQPALTNQDANSYLK